MDAKTNRSRIRVAGRLAIPCIVGGVLLDLDHIPWILGALDAGRPLHIPALIAAILCLCCHLPRLLGLPGRILPRVAQVGRISGEDSNGRARQVEEETRRDR